MPRVVHFEITADQPERAAKFYNDVFGWTSTKWEGPQDYWLVSTGPQNTMGIDGGILPRMDPNARVTNVIDVPSVDEFLEKITTNGGAVALPKMPVPGIGYLAYFNDPEGNTLGIMQWDETAA